MATNTTQVIGNGINSLIPKGITVQSVINAVLWMVLAVIVIVGVVYAYYVWRQKKLFGKKITAFEIVNDNYTPTIRDVAKSVKLGTGGFEILYLKKMKVWRIAYGGRVGKDTYYFFIGKDGYWYNGMLSSDINEIDARGGLIPVNTTNPLMRAQYSSLEKQIDALHGEKKSFLEKYGQWLLAGTFTLIVGVLALLIFKEISPILSGLSDLSNKLAPLVERVTSSCQSNSNLVQVG